jgi:D-alanyl-lipoteichoic acid acyltransferase DltB (MBOAT superfamily)
LKHGQPHYPILPINFNSPYKALNIQDFWRRWHITLSRFLRDYIYIPLGGNRNGETRTYFNLFMVFLIGGFWHGASWMFVAWGALHGTAIVLHRGWQQMGQKMNTLLAWFITFNFVNITWIFFRAKGWEDAKNVIMGMIGVNGIMLPEKYASKLAFLSDSGISFGECMKSINGGKSFIWIIAVFIVILLLENSTTYITRFKPSIWNYILFITLSSYAISNISKTSEFLYFNF